MPKVWWPVTVTTAPYGVFNLVDYSSDGAQQQDDIYTVCTVISQIGEVMVHVVIICSYWKPRVDNNSRITNIKGLSVKMSTGNIH